MKIDNKNNVLSPQYKFIGESQRTSAITEDFVFSLWSIASSVEVATFPDQEINIMLSYF